MMNFSASSGLVWTIPIKMFRLLKRKCGSSCILSIFFCVVMICSLCSDIILL